MEGRSTALARRWQIGGGGAGISRTHPHILGVFNETFQSDD